MGISEGYGIGSLKPGVCTSSTRPASPFDGQVVYMTDVDQTAIWDGTAWIGLDPSRDRNVVINGAMQVAQRGTSTASITTNGYFTADRWHVFLDSLGTWTQSLEADAPTGSGFRNSLKMLVTTADASPDASNFGIIRTMLEGQNVQQFLKGTAASKQFTLSFWVKSNVTGIYIAYLNDETNSKYVSASYNISASATWEKKTLTFASDTTGQLTNTNSGALAVVFGLGAGSNFTGGTLATTWVGTTSSLLTGQTNLAAATSNYWQITGVQLEAGAVATPFEFEQISDTLAKCQRYYYHLVNGNNLAVSVGSFFSSAQVDWVATFPITMRTAPTATIASGTNYYALNRNGGADLVNNFTLDSAHTNGARLYNGSEVSSTAGQACFIYTNNASASIAFSAEL